MKLLISFPSAVRGGAEEYALKIASAATRRGWDVHAGFASAPTLENLRADFGKQGIKCHQLEILDNGDDKQGFFEETKRFFRQFRLVRRLKPDLIHFTLPWPSMGSGPLIACGFLGVPTMVVFQLAPKIIPLQKIVKQLRSLARRRCQCWVVASKQNRQVISRTFRIPEMQIEVIYNSTAPANLDALKKDKLREDLLSELGLSHDSILLLTVGRLHRQKGYDVLFESAQKVISVNSKTVFLCVGDGPLKAELEALVETHNLQKHIFLLGHRTDIPELMRASDLFVLPSRFEGGGPPFAIMEAIAHKLPFVVSQSTNVQESFTEGEDGLVVETDSPQSLFEKLCWAIQHPDAMTLMSENAHKKFMEHKEDDMANQTLNLMHTMLERHRRGDIFSPGPPQR